MVKCSIFTAEKNLCILHGRVFVVTFMKTCLCNEHPIFYVVNLKIYVYEYGVKHFTVFASIHKL